MQEEKSLINERLQARLNAEKDEDRYTELSELQRQLTLIAADPTRTKDVLELQKKISDLEKEIANQTAQEEVTAAQERIDDQIKAYDDYMSYQEVMLNEMLKDANSTALAEELAAVMGDDTMSREERFASYMDWIRQNDDNYKYGTEAMRTQLEQNNLDSWNKMLGWIDTYWDQVHEIIDGGIGSIIDYMKESTAYRFAEDQSAQKLYLMGLEDNYNAYVDAHKDDADYQHDHELIVTDVEDQVLEINEGVQGLLGIAKESYDLYQSQIKYDYIRDTSIDSEANTSGYNSYAGIGKVDTPVQNTTASSQTSVKNGSGSGKVASTAGKYYLMTTGVSGARYFTLDAKSTSDAISQMETIVSQIYSDLSSNGRTGSFTASLVNSAGKGVKQYSKEVVKKATTTTSSTDANKSTSSANTDKWASWGTPSEEIEDKKRNKKSGVPTYASGGLVDYTGPAWVDGTNQNPEAFLSADDTRNIRSMLDMFNTIKNMPMLSPSERYFTGSSSSVGDISITINQAELKSDADYDEVARKVGKAITKQLSKEGLQLSGYGW